ncbi:MAG: DUF1499 domain-containing protein [Pseudomonadota bacterium]
MFKTVAVVLGLAVIALGGFVRLNPLDPKALHVDPETVDRPGNPGHVLMRENGDIAPEIYPLPLPELAARLEAVILATPRTMRLEGKLEDGWASFVTRSRLWGFPDIASVKIVAVEGGSSVRIFSRQRYGYADLGVNRTRVESWLSQL